MAANVPDPSHSKSGGLWARLFGVHSKEENDTGANQTNEEINKGAEMSSPAEDKADKHSEPVPEVFSFASEKPGAEPKGPQQPKAAPAPSPLEEPITFPDIDQLELVEEEQILIPEPEELEEDVLAFLPEPGDMPKGEPQKVKPQEDLKEPDSPEEEDELEFIEEDYLEIIEEVEPPPDQPIPHAVPVIQERTCPACGATQHMTEAFCGDCGWMFQEETPSMAQPVSIPRQASGSEGKTLSSPPGGAGMPSRFRNRYEVGTLLSQRSGVQRYAGTDLLQEDLTRKQVHIIVSPAPILQEPELATPILAEESGEEEFEDIIPTFDEVVPLAEVASLEAPWPSVAWEKNILAKVSHPSLPAILDYFVEDGFEVLIESAPVGQALWDAWDDPNNSSETRYGYLIQIAEGLQHLHKSGAILEGIRPDLILVEEGRGACFVDLGDLLPIPLPAHVGLRGTLYTAPELLLDPERADARADLYSIGAMLYALEYLHHDLEEKDFEGPYSPKLITERYPDVHPGFNRLILKTFCRDLNLRFPTDEAKNIDPTGFTELIHNLKVCQRSFERVRLDIAAWTTTGMVRSGNEDAFAFLHGVESGQDELSEYALVLLADGMGGYEAGEVAAALAISSLRAYLLAQPAFAGLTGADNSNKGTVNLEAIKKDLNDALKHANKEVHTASRTPGKGKRGMGCTAEAVYIDQRNLVVGHVGDSRTYHLSNGRLVQLTRDQTLVNRMVELGKLTPEEAEHHDRKNELQQAIGGQPNVEPGLYQAPLCRGDWVVVCSDGLSNHIPNKDLETMLLREASHSAEDAARRLLNLVNLRGATDNATIVVVRAS